MLLFVNETGTPLHPPPVAPITAAPGENTPKSNLKTALLQFEALLFEE